MLAQEIHDLFNQNITLSEATVKERRFVIWIIMTIVDIV